MRRLRWKTDPMQAVKPSSQTSGTSKPSTPPESAESAKEWTCLAAHSHVTEAMQIANTVRPDWPNHEWELHWSPRQGWEVRVNLLCRVTS